MPTWLPEKFNVSPWTEKTYENLYEIFCENIRDCGLRCGKSHIYICQNKTDGKEDIFWHLTTRKNASQKIPRRKKKFYKAESSEARTQRLPDLRRCERLPWVKPIVENHSDDKVISWFYREGDGVIKLYLWLEKHNHVVIMKKTKAKLRLITAFYVDKEYAKNRLRKKHKARLKTKELAQTASPSPSTLTPVKDGR